VAHVVLGVVAATRCYRARAPVFKNAAMRVDRDSRLEGVKPAWRLRMPVRQSVSNCVERHTECLIRRIHSVPSLA